MTRRTGPTDGDRGAVDLAPFIAWLACRVLDETVRRRHRLVVQSYLEWSWGDGGPVSTRRSRFGTTAARRLELKRADIEEALDRWAEYRAVVARTLPVDG